MLLVNPVPSPAVIKKSDRTRAAILAAARKFFESQPFRDLTVGELMRQTGASRSAFYQYFKDLNEVTAELLEGVRREITAVALPWLTEECGSIEGAVLLLKQSLKGLVDVSYVDGPIFRAVSHAAVSDTSMEQAWSAFLTWFDETVAAKIEKDQALGFIKPMPARQIAMALNRMDAQVLIEYFGTNPKGDKDEVTKTISRVWCMTLYGFAEV